MGAQGSGLESCYARVGCITVEVGITLLNALSMFYIVGAEQLAQPPF